MNVWDDGDVGKAKAFAARNKVTYLVLIDEGEKVFRAYTKSLRIPTNAVINRDGEVVYLAAGFDEKGLRNAVEEALKQ